MAKKRKRQQKESTSARGLWLTLTAVIGVLVVVGGFIWWTQQMGEESTPPTTAVVQPQYTGVTQCRRLPQFVNTWELSNRALLGTALQGFIGFTISEPPTADFRGEVLQHPTWDDAGTLGPYLLDRTGNIFTAPVPLTSLEINPPEEQNRIYLIDSQTAEMSLYAELPSAAPPSAQNPFGVLGLAYDCETESLYASSVAGSGPLEEIGRLYQLDLDTGQVINQFDNTDAIGLGVFAGADGKRLYYGSARTPQVFSVALDEAGAFSGEPRLEFSLVDLPGLASQRVRRIDFTNPNEMQFRTTEFNFSLRIAGEQVGSVVTMAYDPETESWSLQEVRDLTLPQP